MTQSLAEALCAPFVASHTEDENIPSGPYTLHTSNGDYEIAGHGPNDGGYANISLRNAAKQIKNAIDFLCVGYGHSNYYLKPDHPLAVALASLKKIDRKTARYANLMPSETIFTHKRIVEELPTCEGWITPAWKE